MSPNEISNCVLGHFLFTLCSLETCNRADKSRTLRHGLSITDLSYKLNKVLAETASLAEAYRRPPGGCGSPWWVWAWSHRLGSEWERNGRRLPLLRLIRSTLQNCWMVGICTWPGQERQRRRRNNAGRTPTGDRAHTAKNAHSCTTDLNCHSRRPSVLHLLAPLYQKFCFSVLGLFFVACRRRHLNVLVLGNSGNKQMEIKPWRTRAVKPQKAALKVSLKLSEFVVTFNKVQMKNKWTPSLPKQIFR